VTRGEPLIHHDGFQMQTITDIQTMQACSREARKDGRKIAFVPTMGYLHEGHLSLLREGRSRGDLLVLSIFVNPAQFGPGEDLESYPRDLSRDMEMAREVGVDMVFAPEARDMYPRGYATFVEVESITEMLCGASRPGHFKGVATVVCKLFNIVRPHVALFGLKDFQQLAVIRRMAEDLNMDLEVAGMPIVRESDGLAMSSRNVYLSPDERLQALSLVDSIRMAVMLVREGEKNSASIVEAVRRRIEREPGSRIDYAEIRHGKSLEEEREIGPESVLILAARIGSTRLIDNHYLNREV